MVTTMITLFEIISVDVLQESELNTCPASFCSYGSPDNEKKPTTLLVGQGMTNRTGSLNHRLAYGNSHISAAEICKVNDLFYE